MESKIIYEKENLESPWTEELIEELAMNANNDLIGQELLNETEHCKVWTIRLPKGERLPFHKHNKPYFYVALNKGKSRSFYADGHISETEYQENDVASFDHLSEEIFFAHNLENIGNTALHFITVEFKK